MGVMGEIRGIGKIRKKNAFGGAGIFKIIGVFVWGDAVVFGGFWVIIGAMGVMRVIGWKEFLLTVVIFWGVRSLGEVIYWLNQQFSANRRNPPKNLWLGKYFPSDSIWFVYQIFWQCVLTVMIVLAILLVKKW